MPKIPKPPTGYEYLGRKTARKKPKPSGGRDTRPTEMMPRRTKTMQPRPATPKKPVPMPRGGTRSGYGPVPMPKELESMLSRLLPKDMPKNRLPRMPKGLLPKDMPKNRPRKAQRRRGY